MRLPGFLLLSIFLTISHAQASMVEIQCRPLPGYGSWPKTLRIYNRWVRADKMELQEGESVDEYEYPHDQKAYPFTGLVAESDRPLMDPEMFEILRTPHGGLEDVPELKGRKFFSHPRANRYPTLFNQGPDWDHRIYFDESLFQGASHGFLAEHEVNESGIFTRERSESIRVLFCEKKQ